MNVDLIEKAVANALAELREKPASAPDRDAYLIALGAAAYATVRRNSMVMR